MANATRSGTPGPVAYLFEIATSSAFTTVLVSSTVPEGVTETTFVPTSDLPAGTGLYWRATAIDALDKVSSAPSAVQSFTARPYTQAEAVALQLGVELWPGVEPPGNPGHATMGDGWTIQTLHYVPGDVYLQSPDIEMLRCFDLFDRGFNPATVSDWMNANGYPTEALWYPGPEKAVLGLHYVYLASRDKVTINGTWDVVLRVE